MKRHRQRPTFYRTFFHPLRTEKSRTLITAYRVVDLHERDQLDEEVTLMELKQNMTSGAKQDIIPPTLGDYIDYWLVTFKSGTIKKATYARLAESRRVLSSYDIANMSIAEITIRDIKAYLDEIVDRGFALTTVKKQLQIVTAPLKFAATNRWILTDPSAGLRIPATTAIKKPRKETEVYAESEYQKLRTVLEAKPVDAYYAILLMSEMGLRPGEVVALEWDDVNWARKTIHVHRTWVRDNETNTFFVQNEPKTKSSNRILPMNDFVYELLCDLQRKNIDRKSTVMFHAYDGERMTYQALRYQCKNACTDAGVPYKGLHIFRHSFATHQYYKGTSVKILSKILGHASVTVTYNIYIHLYGDALDEMREAMK